MCALYPTVKLAGVIEALLTASESPLSTEELSRLIRLGAQHELDSEESSSDSCSLRVKNLRNWAVISSEEIDLVLSDLIQDYRDERRPVVIRQGPKGWKLFTHPDYAAFVSQLYPVSGKPQRLSGPAMETLAIIAYRQPITKASMEAVRGVSCDGMLQKLLDRELICITGRADLPGRPLLYATTDLFFELFGIRSIEDLPNSIELRAMDLQDPQLNMGLREPSDDASSI